jgi:hypothetical protein
LRAFARATANASGACFCAIKASFGEADGVGLDKWRALA